MNLITQQAALAFLTKVHHGTCSVPADSPFGHTFAGLQLGRWSCGCPRRRGMWTCL